MITNPDLSGQDKVDSHGSGACSVLDLYERFYGTIYAYCARRLFVKDLAEDATACVFLKLIEQYEKLRSKNLTQICNWLYGTASNAVASIVRERRRREKIIAELGAIRKKLDEQSSSLQQLDWPILYEAIFKMKPRYQEILVLRFFEGFETATIAEILSMRPVTVRVMLSRAIKLLNAKLEVSFGE